MKRCIFLLMTIALLLPFAALAEEAADITRDCIVNKQEWNEKKPDKVRDDDHATFYKGQALTIIAPEGQQIGALLIEWQVQPKNNVVLLRSDDGNKFTEILREECKYAQQLIVLDTPESIIRFKAASGEMEVNEITVLTTGEIPAYIPQWKDAPEKVDLMLFSTHPDDEVLWFGGLLPYYAGEQDKEVLVVNAVFSTYRRKLELLDALWTCGVDNYPIFFGFADNNGSLKEIKSAWQGRAYHPDNGPVEVIRQYKPDVVVLQDFRGEYGHNAHILFTQLASKGVENAAISGQHKESEKKYGLWDVPKTYVHLYSENQIDMDWNIPLSAFGGKTALEVAAEALECHVSQMDANAAWQMEDVSSGQYDNGLFGLWRTTVGPDVLKNDLFENIPEN